jgi:hypothetical protein
VVLTVTKCHCPGRKSTLMEASVKSLTCVMTTFGHPWHDRSCLWFYLLAFTSKSEVRLDATPVLVSGIEQERETVSGGVDCSEVAMKPS